MASPSITSLPEQTINTFVSKWNASSLPIVYVVNNDKYPTGATVTNYYTQILIYVNGSLVATLKQTPNTDNNTSIDIRKYVQTALALTESYSGRRDTNASCEFYITGSEEYLDASGTAQSNAITGGGSSVVHYASLSALQFGAQYGGNMYNYVLNQNKQDLAQWMTFFERGQLVDNTDFLLSIIVDEPTFDLEVYQYNENGGWLANELIAIGNNDVGVYRLNLDSVTFESGVSYITVQALVSVYGTAVTELFTIDVDDACISIASPPPVPPNCTWDLSGASYLQSFSTGTAASSVFFKPDGLKMYVKQSGSVREYDLGTAWNSSTAVYLQNFATGLTNEFGLFFKEDGLKMYIIDQGGGSGGVVEYALSPAWDISTASANYTQVLSLNPIESFPYAIFFKPDGTKLYMVGVDEDVVYEMDLGTPWDVRTYSDLQNFDISSQDVNMSGLFFKEDGLKMFTVGFGNDKVYEYNLSTAWNVTTSVFSQSFDISSEASLPIGIFWHSDGTKFYIAANINQDINEYDVIC